MIPGSSGGRRAVSAAIRKYGYNAGTRHNDMLKVPGQNPCEILEVAAAIGNS